MRRLKDLTLALTTLLLCPMLMFVAACSSDNGDESGEGIGSANGTFKGHNMDVGATRERVSKE